jgi:hypothetical protein
MAAAIALNEAPFTGSRPVVPDVGTTFSESA